MKALLLALPLLALAGPGAAETILVGNLITDAASNPMGPATVLVEDGKIVSITAGIDRTATGDDIIDLSDKTVLPGLIDTHVHLTGDPGGDFW